MSPQEINSLIEKDISEDAWARQREQRVLFHGKNLAQGLEHALYLCPKCRTIGRLRSQGDFLRCSCGLKLRYTETGFFEPDNPFSSLADWDDWQRESLRKRDFVFRTPLLFSDENIRLHLLRQGHGEEQIAEGTLCQYEDRITCGNYTFFINEISNMADVLSNRLLFSYRGEYYEFQSDGEPSMRKYLEIWKETQ